MYLTNVLFIPDNAYIFWTEPYKLSTKLYEFRVGFIYFFKDKINYRKGKAFLKLNYLTIKII